MATDDPIIGNECWLYINADKTEITEGDSVQFTVHQHGACDSSPVVDIYINNSIVYTGQLSDSSLLYTHTFNESGEFIVYAEGVTNLSDSINITVEEATIELPTSQVSWEINNKNVQSIEINNKEVKSIITSNGQVLYSKEEPVSVKSIDISSTQNTLNYINNDNCILTITVLNNNDNPVENIPVNLYKNNVLWDTLITNSNGECNKTYNSTGIGDITFEATYGHLTKSLSIKDYLWIPSLDGTDQITSWTNMTNTTSNGIFQSHGSFLTEGWPNNTLWQLDFDVSANSSSLPWRYVGLMPVCAEEINPFEDSKASSFAMTTWEGITFPNNMGFSSWDEQDSMSKITDSSWHHITMIKLSSTKVKTIIDNTYTAIGNYDNLPNHSILHIGTRDNPYNTAYRNTGGIISMKNITVKIYTGD